MRRTYQLAVLLGAMSFIGLAPLGCATNNHAPSWEGIAGGIAVVYPTQGQSAGGVVLFTDVDGGVRVVADIQGLTPTASHAFHIHQFGDCAAPDGTSAGGHYDPDESAWHARPNAAEAHHAGDLGNLVADEDGRAHYDAVIQNVTVAGGLNPIIGRAVIIHAKADQFDQPTGSAGARLACGVIGVANPGSVGRLAN